MFLKVVLLSQRILLNELVSTVLGGIHRKSTAIERRAQSLAGLGHILHRDCLLLLRPGKPLTTWLGTAHSLVMFCHQ